MLHLDTTSSKKIRRTLIILLGLVVAILLSLNYSGWEVASLLFSPGETAINVQGTPSGILADVFSWETAANFLTSKISIVWK
jgi:hypothetical protein